MYSNEDLNLGIEKEIFSQESVDQFRELIARNQNTQIADEENFRLLTGFNDIFVVISAVLFLLSSAFVVGYFTSTSIGAFVQLALSWWLSEYFVLKRRMAFPGIILLLSYVGSGFVFIVSLFLLIYTDPFKEEIPLLVAGLLTCGLAYGHWLRFRVPITVAAGVGTLVGAFVFSISGILELARATTLNLFLVGGAITFILAMVWDGSDRTRTTRRSDVAFWLHLLAAPMVVHPIFSQLGLIKGDLAVMPAIVGILLYLIMTAVSIIIDRRAFMVSSLIYLIYAILRLVEMAYNNSKINFAISGLLIGGSLLLLAVFWHKARKRLLKLMPQSIALRVPSLKEIQ